MKIGIFDSGIGGVSVLNEAFHRLPDQDYIFYADVDHVPYGIKSSEQIIEYTDSITAFLIEQGVDAILIACNTATAVAADYLRSKYSVPIIGMEPAVKPAVEEAKEGRVLVMATPVTIRENKLHTLLERVDTQHRVDLLPMPSLVRFAEDELFEGEEVDTYIEEQIAVFDKDKYSELVLGCTHFNYFKPGLLKAFNNEIQLIDGNVGTVRHLAEVLGIKENEAGDIDIEEINKRTTYLGSGRPADNDQLEKILRLHNRLEYVRQL
ncbi:glutamate racemase [Lachnospiraceae bacterium]|nr:glutamate racemase [Lachnospiraceae bacterium]